MYVDQGAQGASGYSRMEFFLGVVDFPPFDATQTAGIGILKSRKEQDAIGTSTDCYSLSAC